jgi:hypothetical protein
MPHDNVVDIHLLIVWRSAWLGDHSSRRFFGVSTSLLNSFQYGIASPWESAQAKLRPEGHDLK